MLRITDFSLLEKNFSCKQTPCIYLGQDKSLLFVTLPIVSRRLKLDLFDRFTITLPSEKIIESEKTRQDLEPQETTIKLKEKLDKKVSQCYLVSNTNLL